MHNPPTAKTKTKTKTKVTINGTYLRGFGWGVITTLSVVVVIFLLRRPGAGFEGAGSSNNTISPSFGDSEIVELLLPIRAEYDVPAIAAAIVTSDGIWRHAVVGVRKRGAEAAATLEDAWHLGPNTKAMTGTLAASLVEDEVLRWETTVGDLFPEFADSLPAKAQDISLQHLLAHRAGVPENLSLRAYGGTEVRELRLRAVRDELNSARDAGPAAEYRYSNLGYILAGAMMERATNSSWEDLVRNRVFEPLGMAGAGFGGVGTPGSLDQPWGHQENGRPVPKNGPDVDNPPVLGPAGRVHASIQDWARFIADQLRGARESPALLSPDSYAKLQAPPFGGDYGLGWIVTARSWGDGKVLQHAGSNTMNFSNVWIAPAKDVAFLVCINQGGDVAFQASDQAVSALIGLHDRSLSPAE